MGSIKTTIRRINGSMMKLWIAILCCLVNSKSFKLFSIIRALRNLSWGGGLRGVDGGCMGLRGVDGSLRYWRGLSWVEEVYRNWGGWRGLKGVVGGWRGLKGVAERCSGLKSYLIISALLLDVMNICILLKHIYLNLLVIY